MQRKIWKCVFLTSLYLQDIYQKHLPISDEYSCVQDPPQGISIQNHNITLAFAHECKTCRFTQHTVRKEILTVIKSDSNVLQKKNIYIFSWKPLSSGSLSPSPVVEDSAEETSPRAGLASTPWQPDKGGFLLLPKDCTCLPGPDKHLEKKRKICTLTTPCSHEKLSCQGELLVWHGVYKEKISMSSWLQWVNKNTLYSTGCYSVQYLIV